MPDVDVVELAREIAIRLAPDALLDSVDVGAMLRVSPAVFLRDYATAAGFPKAYRLTKVKGAGQPRWKRSDIQAWINGHHQDAGKRPGRPRRVD